METVDPGEDHCPSCGAARFGRFCAQCGEQRLTPELRSLRHISRELVENFTSLDGKLLRTLRVFLLQPGRLDRDWHLGRRADYFRPVGLFLLFNLLFVFASPINDFYVSFVDQLTLQPYSGWARPLIERHVEASGLSLQQFGEHYDQMVRVLARSLIILQVPFFALVAALLFCRRGFHVGDHFTFALNAHAWVMLWIVVAQLPAHALQFAGAALGWELPLGPLYLGILPIGFALYLLLASRTLYRLRWWQLAWRLPLLFVGFQASHVAYRLCQLLITIALVDGPG